MIGYYPDFWWLEPIIMGVWSAWVYIILLSFVIYFTNINQVVDSIFYKKDNIEHSTNELNRLENRKAIQLLEEEKEESSYY